MTLEEVSPRTRKSVIQLRRWWNCTDFPSKEGLRLRWL